MDSSGLTQWTPKNLRCKISQKLTTAMANRGTDDLALNKTGAYLEAGEYRAKSDHCLCHDRQCRYLGVPWVV